jgi:hypothetical protein
MRICTADFVYLPLFNRRLYSASFCLSCKHKKVLNTLFGRKHYLTACMGELLLCTEISRTIECVVILLTVKASLTSYRGVRTAANGAEASYRRRRAHSPSASWRELCCFGPAERVTLSPHPTLGQDLSSWSV